MFWLRNKKSMFLLKFYLFECWVSFQAFLRLSSADFFQNYIDLSKNYFRNTTRVSNSLDILSVLIMVQTVFKDYQQMTKVAPNMERV